MRGSELLDRLELVDPAYVEEADAAPKRKLRRLWPALVAACLCIAAVGLLLRPQETAPPSGEIVLTQDGVVLPQREYNLSSSYAADMLAFFIYQGNIYEQYEWIYGDTDIVGEYLGTATGLIDEWTPKDGYVELAGSVKGDFYAVKGYDPSFMLCMKEAEGAVATYIRNSNMTLQYGAELYEDKLHLSENYCGVQYETRQSWYYSKDEVYELDGSYDVIDAFILQLDAASFLPWASVPELEGKTASSIYDTELYHLYFCMNNGTTIHLRLYENGYVRFQGLLDVCVQLDAGDFKALTDFLDARTGTGD